MALGPAPFQPSESAKDMKLQKLSKCNRPNALSYTSLDPKIGRVASLRVPSCREQWIEWFLPPWRALHGASPSKISSSKMPLFRYHFKTSMTGLMDCMFPKEMRLYAHLRKCLYKRYGLCFRPTIPRTLLLDFLGQSSHTAMRTSHVSSHVMG